MTEGRKWLYTALLIVGVMLLIAVLFQFARPLRKADNSTQGVKK